MDNLLLYEMACLLRSANIFLQVSSSAEARLAEVRTKVRIFNVVVPQLWHSCWNWLVCVLPAPYILVGCFQFPLPFGWFVTHSCFGFSLFSLLFTWLIALSPDGLIFVSLFFAAWMPLLQYYQLLCLLFTAIIFCISHFIMPGTPYSLGGLYIF